MTKPELVAEVSAKTNLPAQNVDAIVDAISEEIIDNLVLDSFVYLDGLGIFWGKHEGERHGRNPKTGEEIFLRAKCWPTFTSGELTDYAKNAGHRILSVQDLSKNLEKKYGFEQTKSLEAIKTVIAVLIEILNRDEKIVLPGLGTFSSLRYPARSLTDPDTGEVFTTDAKRIYSFSAAKIFKERLMG